MSPALLWDNVWLFNEAALAESQEQKIGIVSLKSHAPGT